MKSEIKMHQTDYQVICKTDLYHASRNSGFDKFTGEKIMDSFSTLAEANDAIFALFREDAGRYFANWGLACIYACRPNDEALSSAGTDAQGRRYYSCDIFKYFIKANE